MKRSLGTIGGVVAIALATSAAPALAAGSGAGASGPVAQAAKKKTFLVCKRGCRYRTIQAAVNKVKKGKRSVIKVKPGTYKEGVIVRGHKYDKLTIRGTKKNAKKVKLQGKNAKVKVRASAKVLAQNGIEGINVNGLKLQNMWAKNYATNGFFIHADPGKKCKGFLMKNLVASKNRSYGMFAKHCIGGRITKSEAWGHGDSAFYIGETPPQSNPKWTSLDHLSAYENVLGFSGTNSRYVDIHGSKFFNNGAGIVPNTLDSELFEPTENGKIRDNEIFWNNFNYYLPGSPVQSVSGGLGQIGDLTIFFPTGIGVVLFGADGWEVRDNKIFGNFMWGGAAFSDPLANPDALSKNNQFRDNQMGRGGSDTNGHDFFNDGSGTANCFSGNSTSTFDVVNATAPEGSLYPTCPGAGTGTGTTTGDAGQQFTRLAAYVISTPPCKQEDSWTKHAHPGYKGFEPIDTEDFGPCS
jgi:hypothetical protein